MYKVQNTYIIYAEHWSEYPYNYHKYIVDMLHSEQELIKYLAEGFVLYDPFYTGGIRKRDNYRNRRFDYLYVDNYNRLIDPHPYDSDAWNYFLNILLDKVNKNRYFKTKKYHTPKRGEPIPFVHNWGGPMARGPRLRHIELMYGNPDYKGFNRGSRSDYPTGWWDDFDRHVERNWKRQSKRRHQWKER